MGPAISESRRDDGDGRSLLRRVLHQHGELILYIAAGIAYITLGVFVKQALALWLEGAAFLLLTVWLLPALVRRLF
jgi:hypothetical protein